MSVEASGDNVVIRVIDGSDAGDEPATAQRGEVVSAGQGSPGRHGALNVEKGDEVIYRRNGGTEITVDGQDLIVLPDADILRKVSAGGDSTDTEPLTARLAGTAKRRAELSREIDANIAQLHQLAK
jgi:chaperonin GroES